MIPESILFAFVGDVWTLVEVGAADGTDTLAYGRVCPSATIWAFEPLLRNTATFARKVYDHDEACRAFLFPVALSDYDGTSTFYASGGHPPTKLDGEPWPLSSSLLEPAEHLKVHPWCQFIPTRVPVRRFDSIMAPFTRQFETSERVHGGIDFVHVDVQGAELAVLRGMGSWLKRTRAVWMEVARIELYKGQPLVNEVAIFMDAQGFALKYDTCNAISGDQLWVRR